MARVVVGFAVVALALPAHAEQHVHGGLDVRTDLGTHHTRIPVGLRTAQWDATLVVDPMVVLDGQHDLDLIGEYFFGPRVGVLAGYRWSRVAVDGGAHHQHRSFVGVTGLGPTFWDERLRTKFSLELATLWFKHGGGTDSDGIGFDRNLIDHFSLGLFVRIEYAHVL